jgi:hypothetical protein
LKHIFYIKIWYEKTFFESEWALQQNGSMILIHHVKHFVKEPDPKHFTTEYIWIPTKYTYTRIMPVRCTGKIT